LRAGPENAKTAYIAGAPGALSLIAFLPERFDVTICFY
jgi:hypothetical protein